MITLFDIGSQNGNQFINYNINYDNVMTYAFEPTPTACENIKRKIKKMGAKNFYLIEKAVSSFEGEAKFYISLKDKGQDAGSGMNSLNKFNSQEELKKDWGDLSKNKKKSDKKLHRFSVKKTIKVDVIRLDKFMKNNNITNIDYLHIDAQGHDYEVLLSLGKYINNVNAGMIEVIGYDKTPLYKNSTNEIKKVKKFLENNRFKIISENKNDRKSNELNVRFIKENLNINSLDKTLICIYKDNKII